jgi:hypothetical protein
LNSMKIIFFRIATRGLSAFLRSFLHGGLLWIPKQKNRQSGRIDRAAANPFGSRQNLRQSADLHIVARKFRMTSKYS